MTRHIRVSLIVVGPGGEQGAPVEALLEVPPGWFVRAFELTSDPLGRPIVRVPLSQHDSGAYHTICSRWTGEVERIDR